MPIREARCPKAFNYAPLEYLSTSFALVTNKTFDGWKFVSNIKGEHNTHLAVSRASLSLQLLSWARSSYLIAQQLTSKLHLPNQSKRLLATKHNSGTRRELHNVRTTVQARQEEEGIEGITARPAFSGTSTTACILATDTHGCCW